MATNKTNLSVNSLDFDTIKDNLKTYLKSQDTFKDYDFEGSAMSILLDILAYNTHYEAFYNNMVANEMFLDSAAKRDSVVSLAKQLGYTPTSTTSARATIDISLGSTAGMDSSSIIPIGSKFTASKDGKSYNFINLSVGTIDVNSDPHVSDLEVVEGKRARFTFVYDAANTDRKFIIPDNAVDTSTLTVRVQTSATDTTGFTDSWTLATDINDVTSTSKVYFLQEEEDGKFEVYFGDDAIGKALTDGNLVILEYIIASGSVANSIGTTDATGDRAFSYGSGNTVIVKSASIGGAERESLESIRSKAPKSYQAQDRAVTMEDYKSILVRDYPDVESVNVWGGEDNIPPEYGKVFISFKPSDGTVITENTKESIARSITNNKSIVSITPVISDPNYIYLNVDITASYNPDNTTLSENSLKSLIRNKVRDYSDNFLEKFDKGLRYSKFIKEIDDSEASIVSNDTDIKMEYRLYPLIGKSSSYRISYGNPIYHPHSGHISVVSSSSFKMLDSTNTERTCFLDDDGLGKIRIYYSTEGVKTYINLEAGTIDYENGTIILNNINIRSIVSESFLRIMVQPGTKDIESSRNTILIVDSTQSDAISIKMKAVGTTGYNTPSSSSSSSSSGY